MAFNHQAKDANSVTAPIIFTILANAASKANSRRIVERAGKLRSIKSSAALAFVRDCKLQCPKRADLPFRVPVAMRIDIYYPDMRADLDESALLDALQSYSTVDGKTKERVIHWPGLFLNDRLVQERHTYRHVDAANPRVEITAWEKDD